MCQEKRPPRWPFWLLSYKVTNPGSAIKQRERMNCRLQLLFCFIVQGVPTLETALDQNLVSVFAYRIVC
jgi:hypothetical protein